MLVVLRVVVVAVVVVVVVVVDVLVVEVAVVVVVVVVEAHKLHRTGQKRRNESVLSLTEPSLQKLSG